MDINKDDIKPRIKGKSGFFSWQLFRWIRKNPKATTIWSATWNNVNGVDAENRTLYIGYERDDQNFIVARKLRELCTQGANLGQWAYAPCHDVKNWIDVTEQFWADYMLEGVCAIHGDYSHKWTLAHSDFRSCDHCGKSQSLKSEMVKVESWVDNA